jgi:RsiW-degrading membrane proteinase PrsW (M82 family)
VLIYIASFASLLSMVVLVTVYLADRYEREPIELIQSCFLLGALGQLVLVLVANTVVAGVSWSGPWVLLTVTCAALYLPFHLSRLTEMDERFDGIVYTVAFLAGAGCVIHLNNLPQVVATSPFHAALAATAEPDLRDLLILATTPELGTELGQGLTIILAAVLVGATIGILQQRGWSPSRISAAAVVVGLAAIGLDLLTGGVWPLRTMLAVVAVAVAVAIKRRSVFKDQPEPHERDLLVMGIKTLLIVFGVALLAMVLLQSLTPQPDLPNETLSGSYQTHRGHPEQIS